METPTNNPSPPSPSKYYELKDCFKSPANFINCVKTRNARNNDAAKQLAAKTNAVVQQKMQTKQQNDKDWIGFEQKQRNTAEDVKRKINQGLYN